MDRNAMASDASSDDDEIIFATLWRGSCYPSPRPRSYSRTSERNPGMRRRGRPGGRQLGREGNPAWLEQKDAEKQGEDEEGREMTGRSTFICADGRGPREIRR
ncbi:hypothetical protein B296_00010929 [Ensete ventricosum]|uniref:Uncharacterized protein n=1 Tax=Ensete ventricosum TaxID=4639 RepID=A0A427B4D1_ENSVE|nr:hypothetical protein B296_00010929 [Ensete ventricosum]